MLFLLGGVGFFLGGAGGGGPPVDGPPMLVARGAEPSPFWSRAQARARLPALRGRERRRGPPEGPLGWRQP